MPAVVATQRARSKKPRTFAEAEGLGRLLYAEEVAVLLGLPIQRVYALVRDRILPAVRLGRAIRFSSARLKEWVAAGGQSHPGGWRKKAED